MHFNLLVHSSLMKPVFTIVTPGALQLNDILVIVYFITCISVAVTMLEMKPLYRPKYTEAMQPRRIHLWFGTGHFHYLSVLCHCFWINRTVPKGKLQKIRAKWWHIFVKTCYITKENNVHSINWHILWDVLTMTLSNWYIVFITLRYLWRQWSFLLFPRARINCSLSRQYRNIIWHKKILDVDTWNIAWPIKYIQAF